MGGGVVQNIYLVEFTNICMFGVRNHETDF